MENLDAFIEMMMAERGAAKNTVSAYKTDIISFFKFAKKTEKEIVRKDEQNFISYLHSYKNSPRTQSRKLSSLREYFKFLYSDGIINIIPTEDIESPKIEKTLPKYLSEGEVIAIIGTIKSMERENKIRLLALLELDYATGMRVSELVSLPLSAFNPKKDFLIIKGKGDKERIVPINDNAKKSLIEYIKIRDLYLKGNRESKWMFPSFSRSGHLTRDGFYKMIKEVALNAGIDPQKVSPHVLRHSFASHLIAHNANLLSVQQMLGHSDVKTTEIYTHIQDDRLKELVNTAHPLSKISKI